MGFKTFVIIGFWYVLNVSFPFEFEVFFRFEVLFLLLDLGCRFLVYLAGYLFVWIFLKSWRIPERFVLIGVSLQFDL